MTIDLLKIALIILLKGILMGLLTPLEIILLKLRWYKVRDGFHFNITFYKF